MKICIRSAEESSKQALKQALHCCTVLWNSQIHASSLSQLPAVFFSMAPFISILEVQKSAVNKKYQYCAFTFRQIAEHLF